MENCKKNSKLICSQCKHYDYCDRAKRCDGLRKQTRIQGGIEMKLTLASIKEIKRNSDSPG